MAVVCVLTGGTTQCDVTIVHSGINNYYLLDNLHELKKHNT